MYLLNLGYKWTLAEAIDVGGGIHLTSSNHHVRLRARLPDMRRIMVDPQMYLAGLDAADCTKTCARLATHPWFAMEDVPAFESAVTTQKDWLDEVSDWVLQNWSGEVPPDPDESARAAVEFQVEAGCSYVILPAPLLEDREHDAETLGTWIDAGLSASEHHEVGQPLLVTIALAESLLNDTVFTDAGFLDELVDQVVTRDGVSGVYIVVAQTSADHPFRTPSRVLRAYAHLCARSAQAGLDLIMPNFVDHFGRVCMALGATGLASGESQRLRRLSLAGFKDRSGGKAFPYLYSDTVAAELASEVDLDRVLGVNLIRLVRDVTPFSRSLMDALRRGDSASTVDAWAESLNNTGAAQRHLVYRANAAVNMLASEALEDRPEVVREWLDTAAARQVYIQQRIERKLKGACVPAETWLSELDAYVD